MFVSLTAQVIDVARGEGILPSCTAAILAASICKQHDADPRGVYESRLDKLTERMRRGVSRAQ